MNVKLRRIDDKDLEQIMNWRMDPDITKWMNTDPVLTLDIQQEWIVKIRESITTEYWLIEVDNQSAGIINLVDIDLEKKESSWAYYIGEKTLRSLKLAMYLEWNLYDYVFNILGLNKLYNEVLSINEGVIKLHQMCGSKIDSILKNQVNKKGQYYDVIVLNILKSEWQELRATKHFDLINFEME